MSEEIVPLEPRSAPLGERLPCVAFRRDNLKVFVYTDRDAMGQAAAAALVAKKQRIIEEKGSITCVYAAAPSQDDALRRLVADESAPWDSETCVLHMDEYVGLSPSDPRSFRHYLNTHLFGPLVARGRGLDPGVVRLIRGDASDTEAEAARYAELVRSNPPDVVQGGIGEGNAHVAFNDPPAARFDDPKLVKIVELAPEAKQQQLNEGHYAEVSAIPPALTLTVPALTRFRAADGREHVVGYWSCVAPGERKATAVEKMVLGEVSEKVPASILRTLPDAALFLDRASAQRLLTRIEGIDWSPVL
ncbi:MAG: 6-phosphogluconolactonase [Planctomycetes bacterium]|nr:6-phosphogluconolactonase [Planctomycetota bacterium]